MKNLTKLFAVLMLVSFGHLSNAQFHHEFSNSTTIENWGNTIPQSNPGCFARYASPHSAYYDYDALADGIKGNGKAIYFPYVNFQGSFDLKIEYTAPSAVSFWTNFHNGSSWTNGANSSAPASPGVRSTYTIRSSNLTGTHRFGLFPYDEITIHSVTITNVTYSPGQGCSVTNVSACTDSDGDGECDSTDDFPNDPTKAFSMKSARMNFMYEDLFPAYGDFDFNDLVVSTDKEVITDADNDLRFLKLKVVVPAAGGRHAQGWALELLGINPADVLSVNGNSLTESVMTIGANGTESGQTNAVIPVFDNYQTVVNSNGGPFFNTVPSAAVGTCDTLEVMIEFKKSSVLTIGDLDYNFFAFRTDARGHEIHEMGNPPTDLADLTLFNTKVDDSNVGAGDTYVSVDGLPWALTSVGSSYAIEKADFVEAFLKFASWAQSGGSLSQDWHTNTAEGTYRNSAKIY